MLLPFVLSFYLSVVLSAPRGYYGLPPTYTTPQTPPTYPTSPTEDPSAYQATIGGIGDVGPSALVCHNVEQVEFVDQCEKYTEKTCYTQNKETCVDELYKNCTGVIVTNIDRVCFNVQEQVCGLLEHIHYDKVEETFKVSKCTHLKDRICDTTFDSKVMTKDDFQCLELETPNCHLEEKESIEDICKYSVEFDCNKYAPNFADGYAPKATVCEPKPTTHCYEVPRTLRKEVCTQDKLRYCEKFTNEFPYPVEKQNCHFETRRICEIQNRKRVKKARRFSYSKDCRPVGRELCDSTEKKLLVPVCEDSKRMKCTYEPVETCNEAEKEYCHKVENIVITLVCEEKLATSYL